MISIQHATKIYPNATQPSLNDISLEISTGELHILLGPSGCGKTTLLKTINRLIDLTSGSITIDDRVITEWEPSQLRRNIGYVIQQIGLFPHLSIADNIATVPRLLGWSKNDVHNRVGQMLDLIGLPLASGHKYPLELSGGQQQRVGVARALAGDPPILLMDEPFGAIDPITRRRLQDEFLEIQTQLEKTVVFVTHDIDEALRLGTHISVLKEGMVVQTGTPEELFENPHPFVMQLFGDDQEVKRLSVTPICRLNLSSRRLGPNVCVVQDTTSAMDVLIMLLDASCDVVEVQRNDGSVVGYAGIDEFRHRIPRTRVEAIHE